MICSIHRNLVLSLWALNTPEYRKHAKVILIDGSWATLIREDKITNITGFVVCNESQIVREPDSDILAQYTKEEKLRYDKKNRKFNIVKGENLLCDHHGCWLVSKR